MTTRRRFITTTAAFSAAGRLPAATRKAPLIYSRLGIRPVINGIGTVTILGGSIMPPEVTQAMEEAAQYFVPLPELQRRPFGLLAWRSPPIMHCRQCRSLLLRQ